MFCGGWGWFCLLGGGDEKVLIFVRSFCFVGEKLGERAILLVLKNE